jgi:hypothetical protein
MPDTITLRRPDDWHVNRRDGAMLTAVLPYTARRFAQRTFFGAFSGIALCLIAGCARTNVEANKDASYTREPQRLMVVESMGSPLDDQNPNQTQSFQDRLSHHIDECHILASYAIAPADIASPYATPDTPYVKAWLAKRDAAIAAFAPDTILGIAATQYTRVTVQQYNGGSHGNITEIHYQLTLTDVATRKAVWKAQVTLNHGMGDGSDLGETLADGIAAKLIQDGIFQHCPTGAGQ